MECRFYPKNPDYLVFADGTIYSRKTHRILKAKHHSGGYLQVAVCYNGGVIKYPLIHRMVAESFIPNPEMKPEVNHKNGNKTDNRLENLEWVSHAENANHCYSHELNRAAHPVEMYSKDGTFINRFYSMWEAQRQTGVWQGNIYKVCTGKLKSSGGYVWKYSKLKEE
nr:MAG TPA: homing endonuclease [Caudoviricetes sp.]